MNTSSEPNPFELMNEVELKVVEHALVIYRDIDEFQDPATRIVLRDFFPKIQSAKDKLT